MSVDRAGELPERVYRIQLVHTGSALWPLNQLNAVSSRIDREAKNDARVSKRSRLACHRSTRGLDGGHGGCHVLDGKNHVRRQILHIVGIAMKQNHLGILVGL